MKEIFLVWIYSLLSVFIVSVVSLIGIFSVFIKLKKLNRFLLFFVSFSAGTLLGGAFLHLIPESLTEFGISNKLFIFILIGVIFFFILEKFIHWRHCHIPTSKNHPHPFAYMNLVGDAFHNFLDGLLIGSAYLVNLPLGIATTIAVIIHEIPQEIGDFGVLIHGGFSKRKALFFNYLSALFAFMGSVVALIVGQISESFLFFIIPFTAGGFIYIATADLIPELKKENKEIIKTLLQLLGLVLGIFIMLLLKLIF